jgi:hypothetical protein
MMNPDESNIASAVEWLAVFRADDGDRGQLWSWFLGEPDPDAPNNWKQTAEDWETAAGRYLRALHGVSSLYLNQLKAGGMSDEQITEHLRQAGQVVAEWPED